MFIIVSHSIIITHIQIINVSIITAQHRTPSMVTLRWPLSNNIFQGPGDQNSCEPDLVDILVDEKYLLSSEETSLTLWTSSECIFMQVGSWRRGSVHTKGIMTTNWPKNTTLCHKVPQEMFSSLCFIVTADLIYHNRVTVNLKFVV